MIEFIVKGEETGQGKKGEYYRLFLAKEAYKKSLIWEKQQKISIQKYARVDGAYANLSPGSKGNKPLSLRPKDQPAGKENFILFPASLSAIRQASI